MRSVPDNNAKPVNLFAVLKKRREFERRQLPFIRSMIDFDIIIEIGFAQEQGKPLSPKPLFLLKLGSITTVRRRLALLTEKGIVVRRLNADDRRSDVLTISPGSMETAGQVPHPVLSSALRAMQHPDNPLACPVGASSTH